MVRPLVLKGLADRREDKKLQKDYGLAMRKNTIKKPPSEEIKI